MNQVAHQAGVYPSFCSMKQLGIFLLLPRRDASPSYLPLPIYYFIHLCGDRNCERLESCLKTRHNVPGQGSNQNARSGVERTNHTETAPSRWFV